MARILADEDPNGQFDDFQGVLRVNSTHVIPLVAWFPIVGPQWLDFV